MERRFTGGCAEYRCLDRRSFLQVGTLGALGLTLPDYLRRAAAAGPSPPAKARAAILVFLGGGPSHHDTFDPKPDAPAEIRGEFGIVQTAVAGVRFASSVPLLAGQMKRLAVLRAVTHRQAAHEPGVAYMTTGYSFRPGHNFPGLGAVVGFEHRDGTRAGGLPPYVGMPDGAGGGHLGPSCNPLTVPGDPSDPKFRVPDLALPDGLSESRFRRRRDLSARLDEEFRRGRSSEEGQAVDRFTEQAYGLITSPRARAALDLGREDAKTRDRYGRTQFGQRLLLARRLVEAGVPFVTATDFSWDDHLNIFPALKQRLPVVDRGLAALVADLDERSLLASTLVIVMGEFGRTPKVNPMRGRDHWSEAFSVVLAGGGVAGGRVIGASDKEGAYPRERPVTPEELLHSIYVLLGIDPNKSLPSTSGREIQIVRDGKFIKELTA
ncbi:MAG: DUF1501 domain-containing protein [Planctomycetes bacterium]|nr:DUF1501 domain-containing protein [Planctomycetota bacterium]